jgi:D-arginine dehydrogenase
LLWDSTFVVGVAPREKSFFWLAGQGGYGVQCAPTLAKLAHHLLTGATLDAHYADVKRHFAAMAPDRLV